MMNFGNNNKKVYLAGAIFNCDDIQAHDWRNVITEKLKQHKIESLNPMIRDYRGIEDQNVDDIVSNDLEDIRNSSALIVQCDKPSWGTAMECRFAHAELNLPIVGLCDKNTKISPWLRAHSTVVVYTVDDAVNKIVELLND